MPTVTLPRHLFDYAVRAALAQIPDDIEPGWPGHGIAPPTVWSRLVDTLKGASRMFGWAVSLDLSDIERECLSAAFDIAAEEPDQIGLPPLSDDDWAIITAALAG